MINKECSLEERIDVYSMVAQRAAAEVLGGRGDARTIEAWAAGLQPVRTLGHCPVNNVVLAVAESGRPGRAQLIAKKGASGRMRRPTELVPIPTDPICGVTAA